MINKLSIKASIEIVVSHSSLWRYWFDEHLCSCCAQSRESSEDIVIPEEKKPGESAMFILFADLSRLNLVDKHQ